MPLLEERIGKSRRRNTSEDWSKSIYFSPSEVRFLLVSDFGLLLYDAQKMALLRFYKIGSDHNFLSTYVGFYSEDQLFVACDWNCFAPKLYLLEVCGDQIREKSVLPTGQNAFFATYAAADSALVVTIESQSPIFHLWGPHDVFVKAYDWQTQTLVSEQLVFENREFVGVEVLSTEPEIALLVLTRATTYEFERQKDVFTVMDKITISKELEVSISEIKRIQEGPQESVKKYVFSKNVLAIDYFSEIQMFEVNPDLPTG